MPRFRSSTGTALLSAAVGVAGYFESVCSPHAERCKQKPQNQPEEIKGQAEDDRIYPIPQSNRKAGGNEGDGSEKNRFE